MRRLAATLVLALPLLSALPAAWSQPAPTYDAARLRAEAAALPQLHTLRVSHRGTLIGDYDTAPRAAPRLPTSSRPPKA